jgi:hypothetical protein
MPPDQKEDEDMDYRIDELCKMNEILADVANKRLMRAEAAEAHAAQLEAERDELRRKLEQAQKLLDACLLQIVEDISAIGDDHNAGICSCDLIALANKIREAQS